MKNQLDEIFQKRMDRKDFLKHVGMGVAILTGTAGIVKLLNKPATGQQKQAQPVAVGYGASAYGGRPAKQG